MHAVWRKCGVYVVCRDEHERLLLTRVNQEGNPDTGAWTMPGGGMEWGEQPHDTAHREMFEETGLSVQLGPLLLVRSKWFTAEESTLGEPGHVVGLVYAAEHVGGELRTEFDPDDSTDAAAWFALDEVRALRRVGLVDAVLDLLERRQ